MNPIWRKMNAVWHGKITRGFCVCCAGPDMELMEGAFLSTSFFCFLFILDRICCCLKKTKKHSLKSRKTVQTSVGCCS